MAFSIKVTVVLTAFLLLGMLLAGLITQPRASTDAWNVHESDFPSNGSPEEKSAFLLQYAILAPSSYNAQPWRFSVNGSEIRLFADESRRLTVADADRRELYLGLGAALENLLVAAEHFGYSRSVSYFPGDKDLVVLVNLSPASETTGSSGEDRPDARLFHAILNRSTISSPFESQPVPESALQAMKNRSEGGRILVYTATDSETKKKFSDLVAAAGQIQFSNADYRSELGHWLGQGTMGPTGVQALIAQLAIVLLDPGEDQIRKDAELVNSTPAFGFISSEKNDRESQVRAGQAFERLWLLATSYGLSVQPMSQVLEVPETKARLAELLPAGHGYPQQAFLLGYAKPDEHTPRRLLADFIVREEQRR